MREGQREGGGGGGGGEIESEWRARIMIAEEEKC